jgi:hypothetical protein
VALSLVLASLLWLQISDTLWKLYVFAGVFGFAYGGVSCMQSLIAAELFGLTSLGLITAISSFTGNIGGAVGPVAGGAPVRPVRELPYGVPSMRRSRSRSAIAKSFSDVVRTGEKAMN